MGKSNSKMNTQTFVPSYSSGGYGGSSAGMNPVGVSSGGYPQPYSTGLGSSTSNRRPQLSEEIYGEGGTGYYGATEPASKYQQTDFYRPQQTGQMGQQNLQMLEQPIVSTSQMTEMSELQSVPPAMPVRYIVEEEFRKPSRIGGAMSKLKGATESGTGRLFRSKSLRAKGQHDKQLGHAQTYAVKNPGAPAAVDYRQPSDEVAGVPFIERTVYERLPTPPKMAAVPKRRVPVFDPQFQQALQSQTFSNVTQQSRPLIAPQQNWGTERDIEFAFNQQQLSSQQSSNIAIPPVVQPPQQSLSQSGTGLQNLQNQPMKRNIQQQQQPQRGYQQGQQRSVRFNQPSQMSQNPEIDLLEEDYETVTYEIEVDPRLPVQ
eukprot:Partr_v1_DN27911_c2_g1_i2_m11494